MNNVILDIITEITSLLDELKSAEKNEVNYGTMLGLCEALSIIKSEVAGNEKVEKLLDYDIDAKYLY